MSTQKAINISKYRISLQKELKNEYLRRETTTYNVQNVILLIGQQVTQTCLKDEHSAK